MCSCSWRNTSCAKRSICCLYRLGSANTTAKSASIEDKRASISFSVVAELDIDQDGKLDWIIWLADESREGNYRGYSTFIVSNIERKGLLDANAYSPKEAK